MKQEETMLKRKLAQQLLAWKDAPYHDALVVAGARQVGKTYLVDKFIKDNYPNHLKLDFMVHPELNQVFEKNLDVDRIMFQLSMLFPDFKAVPHECILFFDEVQLCPDAVASLKSFVKDGRYRVIASESVLGLTYKKVRSNPVGSARTIELDPLDFEEFLWAVGFDERITAEIKRNIRERNPYDDTTLDTLNDYFSIYMIVGGLPEAVNEYLTTKNFQNIRTIQNKILEGYRTDVKQFADVKDYDKIMACFDSIPLQLSKESKKFSYKLIDSDYVPTYRTYESSINWIKDAGLILLCTNLTAPSEPLEQYAVDTQFKTYFFDTGLLVCLYGAEVAKAIMSGDTRVNRGAVTENIVAQELHHNGLNLHFFKIETMEIDFIVTLGMSVAAIEVKSGNNKRAKSLRSIKDNYKVKRRIKFEKTNIYLDKEGVEHYPLFACSFSKELSPEPEVDLEIDESRKNRLIEQMTGNSDRTIDIQ